MMIDCASRLVIIGNSGSGKSTLALRIAQGTGLPIHALDAIHWEAPGVGREAAEARARVLDIARTNAWIIEGVFGWLAEVALPLATDLVWIDLPREDCRNGLLARGPSVDGSTDAFEALLTWADDYWTRTTSSSFAGHASLHAGFAGNRTRLRSRAELAAFRDGRRMRSGGVA